MFEIRVELDSTHTKWLTVKTDKINLNAVKEKYKKYEFRKKNGEFIVEETK